jgi:hypothetical protein
MAAAATAAAADGGAAAVDSISFEVRIQRRSKPDTDHLK